jgi:DNA-damage-inducible protein J
MTATVVRAIIDPALKTEVTQVLKGMGLSVSDAIRLTLLSIASSKQLPAGLLQANALTQQAMQATNEGIGLEETSLEGLAQAWKQAAN